MMDKASKIYVAGHQGMVGSAIIRELQREGYENLLVRTHEELDLCRQEAVEHFLIQKDQSMCSLPPLRLAASRRIRMDWRTLCMKI